MTQVLRIGRLGSVFATDQDSGGGGDSLLDRARGSAGTVQEPTKVTTDDAPRVTGDGGGLDVETSPRSPTVWRSALSARGVSAELKRLCRIWREGQVIREAVCICDGPATPATPASAPGCVFRGGTKGARVLGEKIGGQDPARTRSQARVLVREALRQVGASVDVPNSRVVETADVICGAVADVAGISAPDEAAIRRRAQRLCFGRDGGGGAGQGSSSGSGGGSASSKRFSTPVKVGIGLGVGVGGALLLRTLL